MRRILSLLSLAIPAALVMAALPASGAGKDNSVESAVARLKAETGGAAKVSLHPATGKARFVRVSPDSGSKTAGRTSGAPKAPRSPAQVSGDFLRTHGGLFGIRSASSELSLVRSFADKLGGHHLVYRQMHKGVPVFGGELRAHVRGDAMHVVNGAFVPDLALRTKPTRDWQNVARTALAKVKLDSGAEVLAVRSHRLLVFREGLIKGVPGQNRLVWEVEVGDGKKVREFVYMDAHNGKLVDQITGIQDLPNRRAYDALGTTAPGPNYPASPFWSEGDAFPTGVTEADNMISASGETYDLFSHGFGRDSFDGSGGIMDSIFNRGNGCPNASWNGLFISFCPGTTTDDITAHEWGHAYTEYTHNLIYQWQPGALNESYSDIWGETVDRINGRGLDSPDAPRTADACSAFTTLPPVLHVNTPAGIAGDYPAGAALFGPALLPGGLTGDVVLVDDGVGNLTPPTGAAGNLSVMDGCETPFVNAGAIAGKIAMVYRGTCGFAVKVKNAQTAGAIGVIVGNHTLGGNGVITMAGVDATITIPSLSVGNANAEIVRAQLGGGVNATLRRGSGQPIDTSYRWLMGEESTAFGGAIRDMWNPTCYSNAGKVSDTQYTCSTTDNGGVHSNSGVPNHAYALLLDGGTYNGQTVGSIGLNKVAHIYYRAQSVYQGLASDFADHADALEQSCADLIGSSLNDIATGAPSGETINASDCDQVAAAAAAVELRTPPTQCNFQPLLAKTPPDFCAAGTEPVSLFKERFENGAAGWATSHDAVSPADFTDRDWQVVNSLPDDRPGSAMFAVDPTGGTCAPGGDESGVLHLTSPTINVPNGVSQPLLTFEHWLATEPGWDGGNLKVSVNGGPWQVVAASAYSYNPYNTSLFTAPQGNTNPMAGEQAFSGTDGGSVSGSWGISRVDLTGYAGAGDSVQLRYDLGTDGCGGAFGWYVTDVVAYACISTTKPTVSVNDVSVTEGNSGSKGQDFEFSLSHPYSKAVRVFYRTSSDTARAGSDYVPRIGSLLINALTLNNRVSVPIRGDRSVESDETFNMNVTSVQNATILDDQGVCTILNDDN